MPTNLNKFVLHLNVKRLEVSHSLTVEWELFIVGKGLYLLYILLCQGEAKTECCKVVVVFS